MISKPAKDLVMSQLAQQASQRLSSKEALQHKWFKTIFDSQISYTETSTFFNNFNNLKKFQAEQMLKQAAYSYIAVNLTEREERQKLIETFKVTLFLQISNKIGFRHKR